MKEQMREYFENLESLKGSFFKRTEDGYRDFYLNEKFEFFCLGMSNKCHRSHTHEDMNELCKAATIEAISGS